MSLRVWLPLNGTLENKGLDDITPILTGAVAVNNEGKIGKCYKFGTSLGRITIPPTVMHNYTECSVAFWVNILGWQTNWDTFFQAGLGAAPWNSYTFGVLRNQSNHVVFAISDGSTSSQGNYKSSDLILNTWYHLGFTYKSGHCCIYVNGNLYKDYSTNIIPNFSGINYISLGQLGNASNYQTNCKMNDFRIYDHALSPLEVKEISKGLVLHYPLADEYIEPTTNLVITEDGLSNTCYNGATSKYNYGTNTDMYKTLGVFEGRKSTKVYMGTAGLSAYPYVYFDNFNASGTTIQTLSFDYYPTIQNTLIPYSYNGSYNFSYTTDKTSGSVSNVGQIVIPVEVGRWNHITITAQKTDTTNTSRGIGYVRIGSTSHTSTTSNYWLFGNIQVEAKDHATGYAGVGGTRNSNIVYDTSGFCNNGTISGALAISNDTPKYKASTYMPATTTIIHTRCLDNTNQEWSCAAWVKPKIAGNYQNLNNFNEANRLYHGTYPLLYANTGTNDYYNYGNLALPANQWSHIVFVFKNSDGTKLVYINGENHTNTGGPNKTSIPKGIPDTVIIGGSYEGGLCDYREYATALSAEDIKSLYNNSAYIDNQGNIYGAVYEEV